MLYSCLVIYNNFSNFMKVTFLSKTLKIHNLPTKHKKKCITNIFLESTLRNN